MDLECVERVKTQIKGSINSKLEVLEQLPQTIAKAGIALSNAVLQGKKILICGNGGSAADAQHFSAELLGRYVHERPSLAAISLTTDSSTLTAIGNDYGYEQVFARQIQGLGQSGDVLIAISTSGNSPNILTAISAARSKQMQIIALTGKKGGKIAGMLHGDEHHVCIPSDVTSYIQESHIMILHCWCEIIDTRLKVHLEQAVAV